jgi:peptidoglycan/LPS O-acetylase OafA/YrhL
MKWPRGVLNKSYLLNQLEIQAVDDIFALTMNVKPEQGSLPHYEFLDSLRGFAALAVVLVHSLLAIGPTRPTWVGTISWSGQRGVQLFYVVSAFTIFLSLDSRSANERYPVRNFFIRRFFRIAPAYYLAIIANYLIHPGDPVTLKDVAWGFSFLHGWSPWTITRGAPGGWSIGVESMFYLIAPFLFVRITNLQRALAFSVGACAVCPVISFLLSHFVRGPEWAGYLWFFSPVIELPIFGFGIVCYFLWKVRQTMGHANAMMISILLMAIAVEVFASSLPNDYKTLYWSSLAFVPLVLGLGIYPWRWLVNRVTGFIGRISFSIYLFHPFLLAVMKWLLLGKFPSLRGTPPGLMIVFTSTAGSTIVVAWLTYTVIERSGIKIGKNLILQLEREPGSGGDGQRNSQGGHILGKPSVAVRTSALLYGLLR